MGFPAPEFFAWASGFAEAACGLLTRPAALLIVLNMTVVVLLAHGGQAFGDQEKGLLFGLIALTFLLLGAGRYSVDALLRRRIGWREAGPGVEPARFPRGLNAIGINPRATQPCAMALMLLD